jgi:hypothetical protein
MRSTAEIEQEMEQVRQKRAKLVTDQPPGWMADYAPLQVKVSELAAEWMAARQEEEGK